MKRINVLMCFNDSYTVHAIATILSIVINLKKTLRLHLFIFFTDLSQVNKNKLIKIAKKYGFRIYFIEVLFEKSILLNKSLKRYWITNETFYRLFMTSLLPKDVVKILYLDSDIIVNSDISGIFRYLKDSNYAAAIKDEGDISQKIRLKLSSNYYNGGVFLYNLKRLREMQFEKKWINYFNKYYKRLLLQDQDLINIVLKNKITSVPIEWNMQTRMFTYNELVYSYSDKEVEKKIYKPKIIHFSGENKPWYYECYHPLKNLYFKYLCQESPYRMGYFVFNFKKFYFFQLREVRFYFYVYFKYLLNYLKLLIFGFE